MKKKSKNLLPVSTARETAIDGLSIITNLVPVFGSVIASVLTGFSGSWRFERVSNVIIEIDKQIKKTEKKLDEEYIKSIDFQELLEKTLHKVADEHNEEKRNCYAMFLANDIINHTQSYDERIQIIKILDDIQWGHIQILKALMQEPDPNIDLHMTGTIIHTLCKRIPDIPVKTIIELCDQLTSLKLAYLSSVSIRTTTTARGAEELKSSITEFGKRFLTYILPNI